MRIEETIKFLSLFVKEGKFDYIGLSECSADTLRRANAVRLLLCASIACGSHVCAGNRRCTPLLRWRSKSTRGPTREKRKKVSRSSATSYPLSVMKIHGPFSCPTRLVIATAKELGAAVVTYSPLGRGPLTGSIKSRAEGRVNGITIVEIGNRFQ